MITLDRFGEKCEGPSEGDHFFSRCRLFLQ